MTSHASAEKEEQDAINWNNKGFALASLGQYEEALKAYDKAIELKPDFSVAWNNKAFSFSSLGRYEEALNAYDKAIELKPRECYDME